MTTTDPQAPAWMLDVAESVLAGRRNLLASAMLEHGENEDNHGLFRLRAQQLDELLASGKVLAVNHARTASNNPALCDHPHNTNGMCDDCDQQTGPITVTVTLAGLPAKCRYCNARPSEWALGLQGNVLSIVCPDCFTAISPVRAVAAKTGSEDGSGA